MKHHKAVANIKPLKKEKTTAKEKPNKENANPNTKDTPKDTPKDAINAQKNAQNALSPKNN